MKDRKREVCDMKKIKRWMSLALAMLMLLAFAMPAGAAYVSGDEAIETLQTLGLVKGTGNGFEAERQATRAEGLVMLLRFLGKESEALRGGYSAPFTDGGWAKAYIAYAYETGLVKGYTDTLFGADNAIDVRDYLTMMLRALGYSDTEGDFSWQSSIAFADKIGLTHGEYSTGTKFLREDLALISYSALTLQEKDSERKLVEKLYAEGVISASGLKATRLAMTLAMDEKTYTGPEIYEKSSSAVVFMEMYETLEDLQKDVPAATGSAFFVTADGVAVISYHELDGKRYARATTTDGKRYDVTGVLYYDIDNDLAVIRISRTDTNGATVRFFPYLDLGDSDAVVNGETIYNVSSPLGLTDTFSGGVVSNRNRDVSNLKVPAIQISIPVSTGSSGSPILNDRGEVIAVVYGGYLSGQLLNLAVPVNLLQNVRFSGNGTALSKLYDIMQAKKAAATIKASVTNVTLHVGEAKEVIIENTAPTRANLQYDMEEYGIVECTWGDFETKNKIPLSILAAAPGSTCVSVTFTEEGLNEKAEARIYVTVVE